MRYFVLQGIDTALDMPRFETRFAVDDIEQLRAILGDCASDDPDFLRGYELDEDEIVAINAEFGTAYISHGLATCSRRGTRSGRHRISSTPASSCR